MKTTKNNQKPCMDSNHFCAYPATDNVAYCGGCGKKVNTYVSIHGPRYYAPHTMYVSPRNY